MGKRQHKYEPSRNGLRAYFRAGPRKRLTAGHQIRLPL